MMLLLLLQVARVGLYDRNRALKAIRRKVVKKLDITDEDELTEQDKIIAQRAVGIREAAAAKSIQKPKEQLAEEAKGVPRSYKRAQALPEGLWDELVKKYRWVGGATSAAPAEADV
jgi:putative NADH-flavin reductase